MTSTDNHPLAVIELGTTSIRMVVAQVNASGEIALLDELQQAVSLGRDTLVSGGILPETTETCVSGLRSFRRVAAEYGIAAPGRLRVVATSAVREASNRDVFLDRILVATGFDVDVLDEAEVSRLTYRAVQPRLKKHAFPREADVLVVEVGGGSTETLIFRKGKVRSAHMYRMGSLRLRTLIEDEQSSLPLAEHMIREDIAQTIEQMARNLHPAVPTFLLLLGSDARLAALRLRPAWDRQSLCRLPVAEWKSFIRKVLAQTVDETVEEFNLTYPEAETLGPALLIHLALVEAMKPRSVLVGEATLRSGVLLEMVTGERWTDEFKRQVIDSAMVTARKYGVDLRHARNVADYALRILRALQKRYELGEREEVILRTAALLHETGMAVNSSSHHKHSRYLILNSDIFGLSRRDIELAALVARYHRRSTPKTTHPEYTSLPRNDRVTVCKLAAILRVANALDGPRSGRPMQLDITFAEDRFVVSAATDGDLSLLERRVRERGELFVSVFGKEVTLRARAKGARESHGR